MVALTEIPETTLHDLRGYLEYGQPPGGFLRKVLENRPVFDVVGHADGANTLALGETCKWIYNQLPIEAWGNETRVNAWIAKRGKVGALP